MEKQKLPNSTAVIVLGILSVLTCCCVGGAIGIILGIVAIILAKKDIFVQRESKVMTATLISTSGALAIVGLSFPRFTCW
jgi:tetrahydromethanopterin S-methyltransferase subunit C